MNWFVIEAVDLREFRPAPAEPEDDVKRHWRNDRASVAGSRGGGRGGTQRRESQRNPCHGVLVPARPRIPFLTPRVTRSLAGPSVEAWKATTSGPYRGALLSRTLPTANHPPRSTTRSSCVSLFFRPFLFISTNPTPSERYEPRQPTTPPTVPCRSTVTWRRSSTARASTGIGRGASSGL